MIDPSLIPTLERVAWLMIGASRPWWIIGSAAVALHGASIAVRRDVDVLVGVEDMLRLADITKVAARPGVADDRFHSAQVLRLTDGALAIELFTDLRVRRVDGGWSPLRPSTRVVFELRAARVYAPAAGELVKILRRFGRPKDIERADLLSATLG